MKTKPNSNNDLHKEKIFQEMKHLHPVDKDGYRILSDCENYTCKPFSIDIIEGWYRARKYVIDLLKEDCFLRKSSSNQIHVVIPYTCKMALFIARQIALVAHFLDFNEGDGKANGPSNHTVITILYNRETHPDIIKELRREEYLCNLPDVCKCVFKDGDCNRDKRESLNPYSFIDIELELVGFKDDQSIYERIKNENSNSKCFVISADKIKEVNKSEYKNEIDVTNASRVNMVYNVGADIDNLPPNDTNTVERYGKALLYFCYQQTKEDTRKKWRDLTKYDKKNDNAEFSYQLQIRNKLSNVFCADCFEMRLMSIFSKDDVKRLNKILENDKIKKELQKHHHLSFKAKFCKKAKKDLLKLTHKCKRPSDSPISMEDLKTLIDENESVLIDIVGNNLQAMAKCEHARWNVEKLILGFSPLTSEEQYEDNRRFGSARNSYRKKLKNKARHIDLCSYHDLLRINPSDMKYDCFLMMAMVRILREKYEQIKIAKDEQRN